jgi:hypothetical protein
MPSFRYRNVKKEFIEISNTADISFRHNNHMQEAPIYAYES